MSFGILIPWPPSLNKYWRHCRGRHFISKEGVKFRQEVKRLIEQANLPKLAGRVSITISVCPPDRRVRDLDNLLKVPLDALENAGVYDNDGQIDFLSICRGRPKPRGSMYLFVSEIETTETTQPKCS